MIAAGYCEECETECPYPHKENCPGDPGFIHTGVPTRVEPDWPCDECGSGWGEGCVCGDSGVTS